MEMHQVRYFLAAAKTLSFTRGAELCRVSQPALTTAIKKLETRLQSSLFHRDGRSLLLTEFGRQMLPHLEQIVAQAEAAETVAKNFRLLNQVPVRIGVMSTIGPMRLAGLLASFQQKCPGVDAAVHDDAPEALAARLDADELDVAILNPMQGLGESYRSEPLYTERIVVVLPPEHPLSERNALSLRDLDGLPYVDRPSCEMRETVTAMCENMGVKLYAHFRARGLGTSDGHGQDWLCLHARIFGRSFGKHPASSDRSGGGTDDQSHHCPRSEAFTYCGGLRSSHSCTSVEWVTLKWPRATSSARAASA